jgi:hypothetical protein
MDMMVFLFWFCFLVLSIAGCLWAGGDASKKSCLLRVLEVFRTLPGLEASWKLVTVELFESPFFETPGGRVGRVLNLVVEPYDFEFCAWLDSYGV